MAELKSLTKKVLGTRGASQAAAVRARVRGLRWFSALKVGYLGTAPLPRHTNAVDLADNAALDGVKDLDWVALGTTDSPEKKVSSISGQMLEVLIACEQYAVPTVLVIQDRRDLGIPVAAVVTHLATRDKNLYEELRRQVGSQRALLLPSPRNRPASRPRREAAWLRERLSCSAR